MKKKKCRGKIKKCSADFAVRGGLRSSPFCPYSQRRCEPFAKEKKKRPPRAIAIRHRAPCEVEVQCFKITKPKCNANIYRVTYV